MKETAGGPK